MREIVRERGWYCDVNLAGQWAILLPGGQVWPNVPPQLGRIETETAVLPLPLGQNLLFLRLGPDGRIAGTGNTDGWGWEWDPVAAQWFQRQGPVWGIHATIYDGAGNLVVATTAPPGPMGFRYVAPDGRIVLCQDTYGDPARGIYEYTELGDLTIGQAQESGILALYQGRRFILAEGTTKFINAYRNGPEVALAWVREDRQEAHVRWMTTAEILECPEEQRPSASVSVSLSPSTSGSLSPSPSPSPSSTPPDPPEPKDGFYSVCCWPGEKASTYFELASPAHGFEAIRVDCLQADEGALYGAVRTVQLANLRPIAIIWPRQVVAGCPRDIDVEYLNEADIGCPPTPKLGPSEYAALVMKHYAEAKAKGLRQWTGGISNISPNALAWLRAVLRLLPEDIGVAYHRYPPKWNSPMMAPRPEYPSRAAEMQALFAAAGNRPVICTEFGWDYLKHKVGWWVFGSWKSLSEEEVATRTREEFAYLKSWQKDGKPRIGAACLFNIRDPAPPKPPDWGCQAYDGRWKPASFVNRS